MPSIPVAPLSSNPFFTLSSDYLEAVKHILTDLGVLSSDECVKDGEFDRGSPSSLSLSKGVRLEMTGNGKKMHCGLSLWRFPYLIRKCALRKKLFLVHKGFLQGNLRFQRRLRVHSQTGGLTK